MNVILIFTQFCCGSKKKFVWQIRKIAITNLKSAGVAYSGWGLCPKDHFDCLILVILSILTILRYFKKNYTRRILWDQIHLECQRCSFVQYLSYLYSTFNIHINR